MQFGSALQFLQSYHVFLVLQEQATSMEDVSTEVARYRHCIWVRPLAVTSCMTRDKSCPSLQHFLLLLFLFYSDCTIFGAKNLSHVVITTSTHQTRHSQAKQATPAIQVTAEKPLHKNGNPSRLFALQLGLFFFHTRYPCHHSSLKDHTSLQLSTTKR